MDTGKPIGFLEFMSSEEEDKLNQQITEKRFAKKYEIMEDVTLIDEKGNTFPKFITILMKWKEKNQKLVSILSNPSKLNKFKKSYDGMVIQKKIYFLIESILLNQKKKKKKEGKKSNKKVHEIVKNLYNLSVYMSSPYFGIPTMNMEIVMNETTKTVSVKFFFFLIN